MEKQKFSGICTNFLKESNLSHANDFDDISPLPFEFNLQPALRLYNILCITFSNKKKRKSAAHNIFHHIST